MKWIDVIIMEEVVVCYWFLMYNIKIVLGFIYIVGKMVLCIYN